MSIDADTWISPSPRPADLVDEAVSQVHTWLRDANGVSKRRTNRAQIAAGLLSDVLSHPAGLPFTLAFIDRVVRPEDPRTAAANLAELAKTDCSFLPSALQLAVRAGGRMAPIAPDVVVPAARNALRQLVGHLVVDARPAHLTRTLKALRRTGVRLNLNLLGEAVLGDREAASRLEGTMALLARDDVDYVSIKISAVVNQLDLWAHDATVDEVVEQLLPLYHLAANAPTPKFINLDMEEYHDLDLTIEVFQKLLDRPELRHMEAGIVLQAYLPDSLAALQGLVEWADRRTATGGAGIKVRLVKGANLAMERVDAEIHGWQQTPWPSKLATDTHYKRILDWALTPERTQSVRYGVAGHNLFDIALTKLLAERRGVRDRVEFEMLLGMAPDQVERIGADVGGLLLYTPVVDPAHFDVAISYLVRRLEENAASENFMSAVFQLGHDSTLFAREEARFRTAVAGVTRVVPQPRRRQEPDRVPDLTEGFVQSTDSDPSLPNIRSWADEVAEKMKNCQLGESTLADNHIESACQVDAIIATALDAQQAWADRGGHARADVLRSVTHVFAARRGDLLAVAGAETGKIVAEGDVEVSEAIDFAAWYADRAEELDAVDGAQFVPPRVTVVTPPWNFALSITAGSTLAALAAGSSVLLKPAPQARHCAAVIAECLWQAGIPRDVLQLVDVEENEVGQHLVSHPEVDRVILTGAWQTAKLFRSWRHDLPVLAETSGKNSIIVTENADYDLAAADIIKSAFGNAGQKCSAASLIILVGQAYRSKRLRHQILDAASSIRVGSPSDLRSQMGPLAEPASGKLLDGLTKLDPGQVWALQPVRIDEDGRYWSPGVRGGIKPGDPYHLTEYFGPITGIMYAPDLATAIEYQNGTAYGLTAGLHSLDPSEIEFWAERVEAGNLYVSRGITGAIVGRQPFGGWKRSAVGPGAKAGGYHYLQVLGSWRRAATTTPTPADRPCALVEQFIGHVEGLMTRDERAWLLDAVARDAHEWGEWFGRATDIGGLERERNVLRYRPVSTQIRGCADAKLVDVARVVAAGLVAAGNDVSVSLAPGIDAGLGRALRSVGVAVTTASDEDWYASRGAGRVRLVGGDPARAADEADGDPDLALWCNEVTAAPQIELLPFLREQSVTVTAHRFGNPDTGALSLRL
ncbi:aldehyde dehydrogenase family protein [Cutibacterium sp. WCA-380-WT-3A]|uniref:L-glutamate gamma-semialdehyde dehydrogenase n=1 Tax=Cutibacterium porci TaxID=2605781 RepID=A0A7K0JAA0_9ACTN|nr:bifunctional proline dehydrogenase/L-glutamate gamma-semialdehyde dehydrogenase [Cutibacterium porci]MSS46678.1 aldehyde dehydrogenase family protein [Cutibacterium porci]